MSKVTEVTEEFVIPPPNRLSKVRGPKKGSKHKITTLKLMAEEAGRARNADRIQYVIDLIISDAAKGSLAAQKLVWNAVMSNGIPTDHKISEKLEINIGRSYTEPVRVVEPDIVIIPTDVTPEEEKDEQSNESK
jgi:hypothetical protein